MGAPIFKNRDEVGHVGFLAASKADPQVLRLAPVQVNKKTDKCVGCCWRTRPDHVMSALPVALSLWR